MVITIIIIMIMMIVMIIVIAVIITIVTIWNKFRWRARDTQYDSNKLHDK